jgi:ATP-binding cassette, subfamily B, bacterial CvaB/MchF/RaxB
MNMLEQTLDFAGARRTPFIGQNEASECGLACMAMIANHHGHRTDLGALRQRFVLSLKGATLKQVMAIAEQLGFSSRPLRGEIDDLGDLVLPAVLHWDLTHYVVLTRIERGFGKTRYHIHDPAKGQLTLTRDELSRHFTGVILEVLKSESFRPINDRSKLRIGQLWSSMSGFWSTFGQIVLLSFVLQAAVLASPFYMQVAIDTVFPSFDFSLLTILALGFGGLAVINFLATWLRSLVLVTLNNSLSYQITVNLFRHLMRLPLPWFEKRHVGDIVSRFGSTQPITQLLSNGMIAALIDGFMALATLALMFVYSPMLASVACAALLIYIGLRLAFLKALKLRNIDAIDAAAKENSIFIESVRGIAAIKAFGEEDGRQRIWQRAKAEAINAQIKLGRLTASFDSANQFVLGLESVLFVYLAISMALEAQISIGIIFALQAYKQQFLGAGTRLVEQAINYSLVSVHLNRIADIALSKQEQLGTLSTELSNPDGGREPPSIELRNIHFSYGQGEPEVLKGINLKVASGESLLLVGPSGGGKTTLLKVMMGLLKPTHGQVLIDGVPLDKYGLQKWRSTIASLAQDDVLFAGSIADNIAFFDPEHDRQKVHAASEFAAVHADITAMPMGYDSLVGDMGSILSGGQKQRVLLARALYRKPQTLFIDEGTAHLDPHSEAAIADAIAGMGITRVAVAHRPGAMSSGSRMVLVMAGLALEQAPQPQKDEMEDGRPDASTPGRPASNPMLTGRELKHDRQ